MQKNSLGITIVVVVLLLIGDFFLLAHYSAEDRSALPPVSSDSGGIGSASPRATPNSQKEVTLDGVWECLPHRDTSGPQTMECAFGLKTLDGSKHFALDVSALQNYPVDFPTGTSIEVKGFLLSPDQSNTATMQKYAIEGIIKATSIERM